jgi:phenylacetic acid degradation operon negative regulatory protein
MTPDPLDQATRALVGKFQRQRPVRSGSLLITLLGDSIAPRGGVITLGSLIRLAEPFGIPERLVRTSVGRLAKDGWLTSRRAGRQSEYFLTEHGKSRFAEATERIYSQGPQAWDGGWTLLLLPAGPRARRERIREQMQWLGFGQVTSGVLAHPSRGVADTRGQLVELQSGSGTVVMRASSGGPADDRTLLSAGWDLDELGRGYRHFTGSFTPITRLLPTRSIAAPQTAFIIRTLLIHEYRKIHLRDPLLPRSLLPKDWIGATAYGLCRDLYRKVFASAEQHLSAVALTLRGKLPPLTRQTHRRFGGLDESREEHH